MSSEWVICKKCSLKFRVKEETCPRCETPRDETQIRWGNDRGPAAPSPRSKLVIAVPLVLVAVASAAAFVWFTPPGFFNFSTSLAQKISKACEARAKTDCACVGEKTSGMMSPEQQAAGIDTPDARELMQTAAQLCLKERYTAKCRDAKQGNEFECICIIDGAVNAFTAEELSALFSTLGQGEGPPRYARLREGCLAK